MRTTPARHTAATIATILACLLLTALFVVQTRYVATTLGLVPALQVDSSTVDKAPVLADGRVLAEYCSEAVSTSGWENLSGRTSTALAFDDGWFAQDSHVYQHDLATACAVLAAVCNSESQYYSNVEGALPYAEQTLAALGFHNVRTESYALRSNILDEIGSLLAGSHDGAAYTFASKNVAGTDGSAPTTLVFVGIRGSYGSEWLSNFNLADAADGDPDHSGFTGARDKIESDLAAYVSDIGADAEHTRILVTGHSRGGAIANQLAARLNTLDGTPEALAPASGIYAYTFAAPGSTRSDNRQAALYGNIFNVVNSSDIVPQFPLSTWGYGRYGATVTLPSAPSSEFDAAYDAMRETYFRNTGVTLDDNRDALASLGTFNEQAAATLPSADALANPAGIANAVLTLLGFDLSTALSAHYPDTYIAWMQSTQGSGLSFESPVRTA